MNPNDVSAKYYDIVNSALKPKSLLDREIQLIILDSNKELTIFDVGCGTGRHMIELGLAGHNVLGIDSSVGMLNVLSEKISKNSLKNKLQFQNISIFNFNCNDKFDRIILFWNTFNEIALSDDAALQVLRKLKTLLRPHGKIIINMDNPDLVNFADLKFETFANVDNLEYKQVWSVTGWDPMLRITNSLESIFLVQQDEITKLLEAIIKQRWYTHAQFVDLATSANLHVDLQEIELNTEFYFILSDLA